VGHPDRGQTYLVTRVRVPTTPRARLIGRTTGPVVPCLV